MRYAATYNQDGQLLPPGLHIPFNFASLPYIPHPLQIGGAVAMFPVLGARNQVAGVGQSQQRLQKANSGTAGRPL